MRGVRIAAMPWSRGLPAALAFGMTVALASGGVAAAASHQGGGARLVPVVASARADHWGYYFGSGERGDSDLRLNPVTVRLPDPVVQVGTSNSTQYALLTNGSVWAWGQGTQGQLGDGATVNSFKIPVQVQFPRGVKIAFLATDAMPFDTGLAVDTNGNAWGWGANHNGSLCLGTSQEQNVPVQLPLSHVTTLAGADGHAVYDSGGTVYSCGKNAYGVLGDGSQQNSTVPVRVNGLPQGQVTELVSSWQNAGALLSNGKYYDWGYNDQGQLGNGFPGRSSSIPVPVGMPESSPVTLVAEGGSAPGNGQTQVELADGALYAWGDDQWSQLGDGRTANQSFPERINAPFGVTYAVLASGGATSYAISSTGVVYAWGNGSEGEVGDGTRQTAKTPVAVDSGASYISSTAGDVTVAG